MDFIAAGLAAINTAFKANEQIMDALSSPDKNIDELLRRTREVNGLLITAQTALHSAADENYRLKRDNSKDTRQQQLRDDMDPSPEGFYVKKSERDAGKFVAYCGTCWGEENTVRLAPGATAGTLGCGKCGSSYYTQEYHDRKQKEIAAWKSIRPSKPGGPGSWMA